MKTKREILFLSFITLVPFFFSKNAALAARIISFPLSKARQLEVLFKKLRVDTRRLTPDELRFLQDSVDWNPITMLSNEAVGRAIIQPSSYGEQVYRRVFFARLNPRDSREMSSFFQYLFNRQHEIFEQLMKKK